MLEFLIGFFVAGGDENGEKDQPVANRSLQVVLSVIVLAGAVGIFVFMG
jgi:hypothetical protein